MEIEIMKVARKIQIVEAVHFEKQTQMWEIAQWMKAHKVESDLAGCEFFYTFQGEEKPVYIKRGEWIVKHEGGFSSYSDTDFYKKFVIERRGDGDQTPGA